jgi:hypothetical protein
MQAAVDESVSGDIINLAAGVYFENVVIPAGKDGLTIAGVGKLSTTIDPDFPPSGNAFTIGSNGVKSRNLGIRNGQAHGIALNGVSGVLIQGLRIVGLRGVSPSGISGLRNSGLRLLNNEIRAVGNFGIEVGGGNVVVTGNTVTQTPGGILVYDFGARVTSNKVTGVRAGIQVMSDGSGLHDRALKLSSGLIARPVLESALRCRSLSSSVSGASSHP